MKTRLVLSVPLALILAVPALSQRREEQQRPAGPPAGQRPSEPRSEAPRSSEHEQDRPRANQGRIPQPPPQRQPRTRPELERKDVHVNSTPHVSNDHWYGHDQPNDRRYHLGRPFEHGRFEHFGPQYRYNVLRFDANLHRFWLPGGFFEVPAWDWPVAADWCWDCGSDFVVYEDPDHPGWYLVYNLYTGAFVHAQFMGM